MSGEICIEKTQLHPSISMCWDGATDSAELAVEGKTLTGSPEDVQDVFELLCELRYSNERRRKILEWLRDNALRLTEEVEP